MHPSRKMFAAILSALGLCAALPAFADEIDRYNSKTPLRGSITAENSKELTIKVTQAGKSEELKVPLGDVSDVRYEGAAGLALRTASSLERAGQLEKAIDSYKKAAETAAGNGFVAQAIDFCQARTLARLALQDPTRLDAALQALELFRTKRPDSRFQFALLELIGQLQMEKGNDTAAVQVFRELAASPITESRLKAGVWEGRLLAKAGKFEEAMSKFAEVTATPAKTPAEKLRQQEALLARGDCLVKLKKLDEAEQMYRKVIEEASPEEASLQATTLNALGDVLREAGKPKEAVYVYLTVDMVYSTQKPEHAKSLYYVSILWEQMGRGDSANEAREKLKRLYPNSSWAKMPNKP